MKTKLMFVTLGVMATLVLGNSTPANATDTKTEAKPEVTTEKTVTEPVVPPEVVVTVQRGDTLQKIATANGTTYVRLFNANPQITHPDVIDIGDKVTIPAAEKALEDRFSQIAPVVKAKPVTYTTNRSAGKPVTYTTKKYTSKPVNSTSYRTSNGMWCTDYVHSKRPDLGIRGNAGYNWVRSAEAQGKATGSSPRAGAVAVMNGHVAYVESVNGDGSYTVSEMGWNYKAGNYNKRTVKPGTFGKFIY